MDKSKIHQMIDYMKPILKIQDWQINISISEAMSEDGLCSYNENMKKAEISIYKNLSEVEMLKTLVHELLHVKQRESREIVDMFFEEGKPYDLYVKYNERFIEDLAQGIYYLSN